MAEPGPAGSEGLAAPQPAGWRLWKRFWFRIIVYVAGGYVAWCAGLYLYQDKIIFPADQAPKPLPAPYNPGTVVSSLDIEVGGRIESWFIPSPLSSEERPAPAVMFFHGNAEIIDYQDNIVSGYGRLGCSVFLPEYRGYGRSGGKPSEQALLADAVRFYDELTKRADVDRGRVVFHGRSLGGGVAAALTMRRRPTALILESTFSSLDAMARHYWAPAFLLRHHLRTDRVVADIDIPLLMFHGRNDRIIPVAHGRRLRDLAPNAVYIEYECGHNDFPGPRNERAYWAEIERFLRRCRILEGH